MLIDIPEKTRETYDLVRGDYTETFSPKLPNGLNLGAQIFWQEHTFPAKFAEVTDILMYPQFWAWKLTGIKASEVTSLGVHTDLWNPLQKEFSKLVKTRKWLNLFPSMAKAVSILGNVSKDISRQIGLSEAIPVACGIHDSNASLLPYIGSLENKFSIISSGTWFIFMSVGGNIDQLDEFRDSLANVDAFGNVVPTSRFMGGREYEILIEDKNTEPKIIDINYIIKNQIFILPSFTGLVGPFPNSVGRWIGPKDTLSDEEHCAAVALYLAMMSSECLKLVGCGDIIVVEGPLVKNNIFASILSSLLDKPVHLSKDTTGTTNGAIYLFGSKNSKMNLNKNIVSINGRNVKIYYKNWLKLLGSK